MSRPNLNLIPLHCGQCTLGQNHVLGDPYSDDDRVDFTLYSFLADGGPGRRVLIDLGPIGLDYLNDMFRRFAFFRDLPGDPDAIIQPCGNVFDGLERHGLTPDDIDHIVLTHVHADHHGLIDGTDAGGVLRFPKATIHISKTGWDDNLAKRVNGQWASYVDYAFSDYLLEASKTGRAVFHDNVVIVPGVDTIYLGGHSICSQAVRIRTSDGPAIVTSDDVYLYDILERGTVARLHTSPDNLVVSTTRLADLAIHGAILLPCHEPALARFYEEHGEAWLKHARARSDEAARAFKSAPKELAG